jgi:hypothetical protein
VLLNPLPILRFLFPFLRHPYFLKRLLCRIDTQNGAAYYVRRHRGHAVVGLGHEVDRQGRRWWQARVRAQDHPSSAWRRGRVPVLRQGEQSSFSIVERYLAD